MMADKRLTYASSGVRLESNTQFVHAIQAAMHSTYGPRVCSRNGGFAGLFRLDYDEQLFRRNYRRPLLVGCADGAGTKVLLAKQTGRLDTIGIDLVAMSVNDLITCGAEPLFFLDYLAIGTLDPAAMVTVVEGIAAGCKQADCALLGGETAEMPDLYRPGEFDLAGFSLGVVELHKAIDGRRISPGDAIIGLPSNGVHSNGYSLVRKVIAKRKLKLIAEIEELGETLSDALMRPTRIYVRPILQLLRAYKVKRVVTGMAHITGGGLPENVARALPPDCDAVLHRKRWTPPPVFSYLQRLGIAHAEMMRVFNMGIGFVVFVRPTFAEAAIRRLRRAGENPVRIGRVKRGSGQVTIK